MKIFSKKQGFVFIDALLSLGLASIFFSGLIGYFLTANQTSAEGFKRQEALWAGQEGLDALQSMEFGDLTLTNTGSLTFDGTKWLLSSSGPQSLSSGLSRTVRVKEVRRDGSCLITTDPSGTVDPDSYYLESETTWTSLQGHPQTVTLQALRTRWHAPEGSCFGSEAARVSIDISGVSWHGKKQLRDIYIKNNGTSPVTVAKVQMWWSYSSKITQVFLDFTKIWSSGGPGSPRGEQSSGTLLDVQDTSIPAGDTAEIPKIEFTNDMVGSTLTLYIELADGSHVISENFIPVEGP